MSGRSSRESWMLLSFSSRQESRSSIRSWTANQRWVLWRLLDQSQLTWRLFTSDTISYTEFWVCKQCLLRQWQWARIKGYWRERQHRHPAFSYSRLSEVAMFMLNICGRCPARAKHGDNAWKHSEIWVNGEWWGPALEKHSPRSLCSSAPSIRRQ